MAERRAADLGIRRPQRSTWHPEQGNVDARDHAAAVGRSGVRVRVSARFSPLPRRTRARPLSLRDAPRQGSGRTRERGREPAPFAPARSRVRRSANRSLCSGRAGGGVLPPGRVRSVRPVLEERSPPCLAAAYALSDSGPLDAAKAARPLRWSPLTWKLPATYTREPWSRSVLKLPASPIRRRSAFQ